MARGTIAEGIPTRGCIDANAHALACYAGLCQEAGLVPIVEPEVLMDGEHPLERCREVTEEVLRAVFNQLYSQRVTLEDMILKPNMVLPGKDCPALGIWKGQQANSAAAQQALYHRARCNSAARRGRYGPEMENSPDSRTG